MEKFTLTLTLARNAGSITEFFTSYIDAVKKAMELEENFPGCSWEITTEVEKCLH